MVLSSPILGMMALKGARTLQEMRARREGRITFGGDDRYQARDVNLDIHTAVMVARVRLKMEEEAFEEVVARVEATYYDWYRKLEQAIVLPEGQAFQHPLEIVDHAEEHVLSEEPLLAKILIYRSTQTIVLMGNHIYLGGYLLSQFVQIVFCETITTDVFPRNRYLPVVTELMMLAFFGKLLFLSPRTPWPLHEDKSQISRFYLKFPVSELKEMADDLGMSVLYVLIARHIFIVMQRMNRDRLRVTLPVSFRDETSFNTVGGMLLDVEAHADVASLARTVRRHVKRSQWQVAATNHIQRVFPTRKWSEDARNTVDLTLTVVPGKTLPHNLLTHEMKDYEFTMDSIHYPVYIMAFIFEDHVHTSVMVNTPRFDSQGLVAEDGARPMHLPLRRGAFVPVDEAPVG